MAAGPRTRILGGEHRGRRLTVAAGTRPTESRVREAVFSIWAPRVAGCRFLDLFAGSGAVGLEAWSRGAARVVLVEAAAGPLAALERNLATTGAGERCEVVRGRLPAVLAGHRVAGTFDLAYLDPPYALEEYEAAVAAALARLAAGGELGVESDPRRLLPERLEGGEAIDRRVYGGSAVTFYRAG